MRLLGVSALILAAAAGPPADAATRALFVGVDTYQYGGHDFANLSGPVGDVALIKRALRDAKKLDLDPLELGTGSADCKARNAVSITLVEGCATYDAITNALASQIAASRPGDIVLFYFAGHGSTYADDSRQQASGYNDTILPYDARKPGVMTEILDVELRHMIDGAVSRGVSVVTIFDSCHSGTATRDLDGGHSREVPRGPYIPLSAARRAALAEPLPAVTLPTGLRAYRVHLAAATDTETANEYDYQGVWHGAFSLAIAQAITARPGATYGDLANDARALLDPRARTEQHPQAEGALAAALLGPDPGPMRLYAATSAGDGSVMLAGGMLAGISEGSTFTLHRDITAAAANRPLATATVERVGVEQAVLRLDKAPARALPATLEAREAVHKYGTGELRVAVRMDTPAADRIVRATLKPLDLVTQVRKDPDIVIAGAKGATALCSPEGRLLKPIGHGDDPAFADRIAGALRIVARYKDMLALTNATGAQRAALSITRDCGDLPDGAVCPDLRYVGAEPIFAPGDPFRVSVQSAADRPQQHLYLFDLEPDRFSVTPLMPMGAHDVADPGHELVFTGTAGEAGRAQLLLLATDADLDLSALAQDGLSRSVDPLARLLQAATNGTRAIDPPVVGNWGGLLLSLRVEDPHPKPKEPSVCDMLQPH